jgi:hypothetical protein
MPKFFHIVQVCPVELGEPNLYKVKKEWEFDTLDAAEDAAQMWNNTATNTRAVYVGCVNDGTGELV